MPAERERLILQHLELVHYVANRVRVILPGLLDVEDYVSIGTLGLLEAVDRYEPGRGVSFGVFAYSRIRGAIWDEVRHVTHTRKGGRFVPSMSLDMPVEDGAEDGDTLADTIPHPRAVDPAIAAERAELRDMVMCLQPRDRAIVGLCYWMGLSQRQVAGLYGVTESRVSQLHARAMRQLRRALS